MAVIDRFTKQKKCIVKVDKYKVKHKIEVDTFCLMHTLMVNRI